MVFNRCANKGVDTLLELLVEILSLKHKTGTHKIDFQF